MGSERLAGIADADGNFMLVKLTFAKGTSYHDMVEALNNVAARVRGPNGEPNQCRPLSADEWPDEWAMYETNRWCSNRMMVNLQRAMDRVTRQNGELV